MKKIDHRILARYLSGNSTQKEKHAVKKWAKYDSSNKRLLEEYKTLWEQAAMNTNSDENFDVEQGWEMLKKHMDEEKTHHQKNDSIYTTYFKQNGDDAKFRLMRVAAIFIAAAFIGFFAWQSWEQPVAAEQAPVLQEIVTDIGQRSNLTLADGTRIILNADSKLRLPKIFKADKREVFLEGQAYFEVAENSEKPFLVHVDGTTVRVLGTSFSVSAYPEDEHVQVVVKEGRVSFEATNSAEAASTIITANQLATYDEKSDEITTAKVDEAGLYLGWLQGSLNFKETLMKDVANDLERRYGVRVSFNNEQIKEMKLTARLKSKRIKNVLDVIALSLNLNYNLNNNRVTFYKR